LRIDGNDCRLAVRRQGEQEFSVPIRVHASSLSEHVRTLLAVLEPGFPNETTLRTTVRSLTRSLLHPIASAIHCCSELIIELPRSILDMPFDLLTYRRLPLGLKLPTSYRIGQTGDASFRLPEACTALVLSDGGADPERACLAVASRLGRVTYQDSREVVLEHLRLISNKDVILCSLHGHVGRRNPDKMQLATGELRPADLATLRPKLAYFDSCRLGVSTQFLKTLRSLGTIYYIAPIISNEAGASSTQTMVKFFEHLLAGRSPEMALFLTRKELWRLYRRCELCTRWWRTLAFRVYRLN
jgi:hypothetical protein